MTAEGAPWSHVEIDREALVAPYLQVATVIRGQIVVRQIRADTPLPTEAVAAEQWGVSRETVRRAYGILRQYGVIRSEHGKGSFVGEVEPMVYLHPEPGTTLEVRRATADPVAAQCLSPVARALSAPVLVVMPPDGGPEEYYEAARVVVRY
jgi:DNA-binding transcriptional regulator YhcF (GntR family)